MAVQMPHDMPSMPPDRRTAHHSHMFVRRPALVTFRSAPFRTGKYPPRSCAMRDGPWPVSPWRRQISLHGTPISGHLYRGAPCPGMGKEESGKSKSPRQANRETGKRGSRRALKSSAQGLALTKPRRRLSRSTNLLRRLYPLSVSHPHGSAFPTLPVVIIPRITLTFFFP